MSALNLGILAHVDAGKTSLTERLLFEAGIIEEIGSVDDGSTQTDTLALERQRGITIKSAVASFVVGDVTVNLIDTPGHPDFIAEVERVLSVLDGAVLVISAVEGVQPQTRLLMRTLQRLAVPTVIFVNKIDRGGADCDRVLADIAAKLTPAITAMGSVRDQGTRSARVTPYGSADSGFTIALADLLAEHDDALLAAYVADEAAISYPQLTAALAAATKRGVVHPVFLGSAITGAGVDRLAAGITALLPLSEGNEDEPARGTVFKVERGPAGEKIAYVRMFAGTVRVRERLQLGPSGEAKVSAISVFDAGANSARESVCAGQIARLWGLSDVRIGDAIGSTSGSVPQRFFAPPTFETLVVPARRSDKGALHAALTQLAEQDPLINLRQDDARQEIHVSLYGEVQKEVIQATLASEFGLEVGFRETTTICIERLAGSGEAAEFMDDGANPFRATVGLRIEPAERDSGVTFRLEIELGALPHSFVRAVEETVHQTLLQGLRGWQVTDCVVTMTHSGYVPPPPFGWSKWSSSAGDFRNLTPLVLMAAVGRAGTTVHEPVNSFRLEIPADTFGPILPVLSRMRAVPHAPEIRGSMCVLEGDIPAARVNDLQQQLPALSRGEDVLESSFSRYQPVSGPVPVRPRSDNDPLNRKEYLLRVQRRFDQRSDER